MSKIIWLQQQIQEERDLLINHPLYSEINSVEKLRIFTENHVFAVWDFMSLLKSLQIKLTVTTLPWLPSENPNARRLINEIVLAEESDINANGQAKSHFELYRESMIQLGANTLTIDQFIEDIKNGQAVEDALNNAQLSESTKSFVHYTFEVINRGKVHEIAALFTFGREDLIPDMFSEMVKTIGKREQAQVSELIYYLDRHIELDGDEHGPLALELIQSLCQEDEQKWLEAVSVSKKGLIERNNLWSGILSEIRQAN